jgi:hypothetical protein
MRVFIINQEFIKDIPNNLKEIVPKDFDFKEWDQKFYVFIKILFISRKQISNKDYIFLVKGLFYVLSELGVDKNIQIKYKEFLSRNPKDFLKDIKNQEYENLKQELEGYCKIRDCKFNYSN